MRLLKLAGLALSAQIKRDVRHPDECNDGLLDEMEINKGLDLFEGDIELTTGEMNIQTDLTFRWPGARLYVDVGADLSPNVVGVLHQAIRELEAKSQVRFYRVQSTDADSIRTYRGGGCSSSVGRQGGQQSLSLADGCARMATIMHEFTHAMGVLHAHSRPDRDEHVIIHWENIQKGYENNFSKAEGAAWTTFDMPYNYMSVMHYGGYGFSTNDNYTIETIDPFYQELIGQRASYTAEDTENIRRIFDYNPDDADFRNCQCEFIELSGAKYNEQLNGVYTRTDPEFNGTVNARWNYLNRETGDFLKYQKKSQRYQWVVTGTLVVQIPLLKADSTEICAENIGVDVEAEWNERNLDADDVDGAWEVNNDISVRCTAPENCCEVLTVDGTVYKRVDFDRHHRPRYSNEQEGKEIVYSDGAWYMLENMIIVRSFLSQRYCLSDALADLNHDEVTCGEQDEAAGMGTSDTTDGDDQFWFIENWAAMMDEIETGEYIESPVFTVEGYRWQMLVYPRGKDEDTKNSISMYAYQVPGFTAEDDELQWPLHGKQITMGIVEQGKDITDRVTMRRSFVTLPRDEGNRITSWNNPSRNEPYGLGWTSFLTHDLLFYRDWNYVYEDTMKFSFRMTEATGVFLNCEVTNFDRCLWAHEPDTELSFDESGSLYERGKAHIRSTPTHQWGQRCFYVSIESATSFTLSLFLELVDGNQNIPQFRQRFYPTGQELFTIDIDLGIDDYFYDVQQFVHIELLNHESAQTRLVKMEQKYGACP